MEPGPSLSPMTTETPQLKWVPPPVVPPGTGLGQTPPASGRGINPMASWRAHKRVALVIFLVIAALGVPLGWKMGKPGYATEAVIRVSPRFAKNLNSDQELELQSNNQYREFVQQQVLTINRFDIVSEALKRLGDKRKLYQLPAENDRRVTERLARELTIKPVPDSYLITIGLEGAKAEPLADVVNAVVNTYLERARTEEMYGTDQRRANIAQERDRIQTELSKMATRRAEIGQEIGVTTFTTSMLNPYDQMLIKSKDELETAHRERILAEAKLNALEKKLDANDRPAIEAMAEELAIKDAGLNSLKSNLYLRRSQLLSKLSGISPDHPGRPAIEHELKDIEDEIARATAKLSKQYRSMFLDQRRAELAQAQRIERELDGQVKDIGAQASWFASRYHEAVTLSTEIDRLQKRLATIDDRDEFLALEANAPGWVRMVTPARTPDVPNKGGRKKLILLFALVGAVLAAIVPIVIDLLDPRIYVAGQLQKLLTFPPVGWILDGRNADAADFINEQFVRLATQINRDRLAHGTRVIVFTSTKNGEGVSTIALEVGRALTVLGLRAVVAEVNALTPDRRYRDKSPTSADTQIGLTDLLENRATVGEAVLRGEAALPDRLAVGAFTERRPLATLAQYRVTLGRLAETYDFVLLDASPVLLSVDTELLVGLADATLLVVEAGALSKGQVKRAVHALERLSPPTFGAILNRVQLAEVGGDLIEQLQESKTGKRLPPSKLLSPWLWK